MICRVSNWNSFIILSLSMTFLLACTEERNKSIQLIKNGVSEYTILISKEASKEELRAATFLQDHLIKISNCKIPIRHDINKIETKYILISKTDQIINPDGFQIKTRNKSITILGGDKMGCVYGVVDILNKELGVRYYSPDYIIIPRQESISLPYLNYSDSSNNSYRAVNGQFVKNKDYKDFNRLHEIDDVFGNKYYVHTFNRLLPWKEYFDQHPEYYAFMNGKRIIDQLCLSNPDVLQITIDKLRKEMKNQAHKKVWSVSQDDNFSYCQCEACKIIIEEEQSPAGPIIRFVNEVAREFPDHIISTLAYQYSRKAPVITKPLKNVQVMLCTIELNRSQPIANDSRSQSFLKDLNDWGEICNHIYLWDYTVDFAHSQCPFPNIHVLQPNIQLFVDNNVNEHFQQSNTAIGHEFSELKSYLLSKLLWNPNVAVDSVIFEFTNGFYGDAAPYIRKYIYQLQSEILKTNEWLDIYGPTTNYQNSFLSEANISVYNSYFDEAENAVENQPDYLLHVRTARMSLQYAIMEIGKNDMFGSRGWYKEKEGEYVLKQNMTDELDKFYQTSQQAHCKYVNESRLSIEEYYQSSKRFIDVQVKGNFAFRKKVTAEPLPASKYSGGDLAFLTNGVKGANDYKVHWLGWEAQDFSLILDLEDLVNASKIEISTLWDRKSWIMHPLSVSCYISTDGKNYQTIGTKNVEGNQREAEVNKTFSFDTSGKQYRYVKFYVEGSLKLFDWHPSAGYPSWAFVDEIVVK
jgi:uncharacterized protein DUF4838/F5/8 type C domain-containing protein